MSLEKSSAWRKEKALAAARRALEAALTLLSEAEEPPTKGTDSGPTFYTSATSPLGRRLFLRLARQGAFPSHRVGRLVLAKREAVDAWIAAQSNQKRSASTSTDEIDALLRSNRIRPASRKAR
ncbi:hypothetical protein WMF31_37495 [Sorangium sp. So ce1036]|uniref:hypothetical protein n=1 Tax=Sorangium sp. So ce1036 TaxID=3133328 RepID=UPI003F07FE5D